MSRLELGIAWRYLRSRKGSRLLSLITVIAIGGVVVGVSALILIVGVMNGLQNDLKDKILVGSPDIRVLTYGDDLTIPKWRPILTKVQAYPGVVAAAPFVLSQGLISTRGHQYIEPAQIEGIEPQGPHVSEPTSIREHPYKNQGDFRFASSDGKVRGVVIGKLLADRLNVVPGDTIRLVTAGAGGKIDPVVGVTPRAFVFEVTGVFETGMYEYDNAYVFMSLAVSQEFAGLGDAVTGIEVRATTRNDAAPLARELEQALGFPYRTVNWEEQNQQLFQALKLEKLGMSVILLLIVVVAAFNIVSTLTMVVTDKTREIGILKAMGMPAQSIRRIFFAQGVVIGVVGTLGGLAIGLTASIVLDKYKIIKLSEKVYFIDHLPVNTQPLDVTLTIIASLGIAALATLYPSIQASRLYPIEAIHHD